MFDLAKWIIVGLAVAGLIFNTGVLYNDIKHLKKSVDEIWTEINKIKDILIERSKE
jgi:hypothetical protein